MSRLRWIVALVVPLALVWGCGGDSDDAAKADHVVTAELDTFTMDHYFGDDPRWKLVAPKGQMLTNGTATLVNPRVVIYEKGVPSLTITGERGLVNRETHDLSVTGNVRATAPDAFLLTDYLKWVDRDGTLTSPREVTIHRGRSVLAGDNLVSRPNLKSATLSNTRFRFNTGDEKIQEYPLEGTGDDSESD